MRIILEGETTLTGGTDRLIPDALLTAAGISLTGVNATGCLVRAAKAAGGNTAVAKVGAGRYQAGKGPQHIVAADDVRGFIVPHNAAQELVAVGTLNDIVGWALYG